MIVKTTGYSTGKRAGTRAVRHLGYLIREGTRVLDNGEKVRAKIYDSDLQELHKSDFPALKEALRAECRAERRLVISPHPELGNRLSEEELLNLASEIIEDYQSTVGQSFDYFLSPHSNTEINHVHVLIVSSRKRDIFMNKKRLQTLKSIAESKEKELADELGIDLSQKNSKKRAIDIAYELKKNHGVLMDGALSVFYLTEVFRTAITRDSYESDKRSLNLQNNESQSKKINSNEPDILIP